MKKQRNHCKNIITASNQIAHQASTLMLLCNDNFASSLVPTSSSSFYAYYYYVAQGDHDACS